MGALTTLLKGLGATWGPLKRHLIKHGNQEDAYDIEADLTNAGLMLFQTDRSLALREALQAVGRGSSLTRSTKVSGDIFELMGTVFVDPLGRRHPAMDPHRVQEATEHVANELATQSYVAAAKAFHCAGQALRMYSTVLADHGLDTEDLQTSVTWCEQAIQTALGAHLVAEGFPDTETAIELAKTSPEDFPTIRLATARSTLRQQTHVKDGSTHPTTLTRSIEELN